VYPALAASPPIAAAMPPVPMILMVLIFGFLSTRRAAPLLPFAWRHHIYWISEPHIWISDPIV
jgi:hypothetical protein